MDIDLKALAVKNRNRWVTCVINSEKVRSADLIAHRLLAPKERYQAISLQTKVPWPIIAVIHEREASESFLANLAQGDRWDRVSTHIPRGEGPYHSFEEAAIHALVADDHLNIWPDWSIGGALTGLEKFNGLGYAMRGRPSAYVWSWTSAYLDGKFVGDNDFDPHAVDQQPGCAALLARMMFMDDSIFTDYGWGLPLPSSIPLAPAHDTQWIQDALNKLGADPKLNVDGHFGPKTKAALRAFQAKAGILDDGKFGPVTDGKVYAALKALPAPDHSLTGEA